MTIVALVRHRLAASWLILAMLLFVTVLADLVSDRLGINALLHDELPARLDVDALLIWAQRAVILLSFLFALLGWLRDLRWLSLLTIGLITFGLLVNVVVLIVTFPRQPADDAFALLRAGFTLWLMNTLVFAAWYWLVDTGGRHPADAPPGGRRDLLFPQHASSLPGWEQWYPEPLDYVFVAFNTSTSFSPSDTLFLSRRAKLLLMVQALTSLVIVTVILAHAINAIQ